MKLFSSKPGSPAVDPRDVRSSANVQGTSRGLTAGFTLIETLFAVLLFTTSLVALMAVAGRGISSNTTAREDLTARYLALEGLEVARNIRDTNYVLTDPAPLVTGLDCVYGCDIDYPTGGGAPQLVPGNGQLFVGSDGSYSSDPNGTLTPFSREVSIFVSNQPDGELTIQSRVTWQSKGVQRSVEYIDYLKKWR